MDGLHDLCRLRRRRGYAVASLWNNADPIVPDRAKLDPIAWWHSGAPTAYEGEMSRSNADRLAGNGRRFAGDRYFPGIPARCVPDLVNQVISRLR
jgi:hypothetical protein